MKKRSERREASKDLEDNKPRTPRNSSVKNYAMMILILFGVAIIGFVSIYVIALFSRYIFQRFNNANQGESSDSIKIYLKDMNEQSVSYPLHIQAATPTIEFCETQPLTTPKIKRLFANSRIAVHQNSPEKAPKDIQQIVQTHFSALKVSQTKYSKVTPKQIISTLQRDFIYVMQQAHPVTQRLMSIFLTSRNPRISIFTDTPEKISVMGAQPLAGRYMIANNTVRLITKAAPSMILPHEGAHAGASIFTYGDSPWQNGEFRYPVTQQTVNTMIAKAFPCEQEGFYDVWKQEVNQVLSYNSTNPEFLDIAKDYKPEFFIWLSEKSLIQNFDSDAINGTFTFNGLAHKVLISPGASRYDERVVPNFTMSGASYYRTVLLERPVKIVDLNRDTEFPGVGAIRVTPVTMEPKVKAHYLLEKFGWMKKYANTFRQQNGHCQEAFGVTFELNREVIPRTLPRSISYLERRLDDYERARCQDGGVPGFSQ